ncbi:MAG: TonB-dependent receptor, partial [Candidatus Delongbacteria bacterium]|nr:TonB-dependent receptor [Candidatus Delongbacteria bacterium]
YFQDKIEYPEMIMNIGLRYDYFNSQSEYHTDILQPDGVRDDAETKHMVAPRLGVSFPITDRGIIHFSYGHFYQMPSMSAMYVNAEYELPAIGTYSFGNANLDPQKTVIYEIGLQQQIGNSLALEVTGFYKDIRDLLALQNITFRDVSGRIRDYQVYVNDDYGNTKGITLSLSKMRLDNDLISASLDYTFQVAEGNNNDDGAFFFNSLSGYVLEKEIVPLDWDLTHSLNAQVTLMTNNFGLSVIGKLNSGLPYSPEIPYERFDVKANSGRKPFYKNVDMQASYIMKFSGMRLKYFFKIFNLFDFKNERYVYGDTGRASYTYYSRSQYETNALKNEYGKVGVQTYDDYIKRPTYFYPPREVRLGVMFEY